MFSVYKCVHMYYVLYIFNLRETDNCNLSVPDNGHSARPRMIVAVQKIAFKSGRLKATPLRTREGVALRVPRILRRSIVLLNSNSSGQAVMATKMHSR